MAVTALSGNPNILLLSIKEAIDEGKIITWAYDKDGDFTHTADQWKECAWLRPKVQEGRLVFNIVPPRKKAVTTAVYAIYHGRFIEMLLRHFDSKFTEAWASAFPIAGDRVAGSEAPD